jgi:hypothetical protein
MGYSGSQPIGIYETPVQIAARKKAEADAAKRAKALASLQTKSLGEAKKKAALDKASKTLNLEAIGIEAALKGKISETDRISLELQKAILDGNATLAEKLAKDLETAVKRNNELRLALLATPEAPNPYRNWQPPRFDYGGNVIGSKVPNFTPPSFMTPEFIAGIQGGMGPKAFVPPEPVIIVKVELDGQTVTGAITDTQVNQSLSGTFSDVSRYNGRGAPSVK